MPRAFAIAAAFCLAAMSARAEDSALLKRGEYLARAGDCIACHSKPGSPPYSGGAALETPYGPLYPPNLTPDKATGIGAWSDDEFYRALHEGLGRDGEYLYPAFPFPWYTNVTREDALAIKAYLFSLAPVNSPPKPPGLRFPFDIRQSLAAWRVLFFKAGTPQAPTDKLSRGRYLVEGLGHCGECHNHEAVMGASDWSGRYEGGAISGWYAPNLTSDGRQGVGQWSEDEIAAYLKTGAAPGHGVALGPMQETINDSLSHLSDDDLHAIAAYLKSIPAKQTYSNESGGYASADAPGEAVYLGHCASCHGVEGQGRQGRVPALAGNGAVAAGGPQNVIRAVLGGLAPRHGLGPMPAVGASLSDAEVAAVADYVRNAFGNASPATSDPSQVARLRNETPTAMAPQRVENCGTVSSDRDRFLDGEAATIADAKPEARVQAVDEALKALGGTVADDALAELDGAFCRATFADPKATLKARAERIGDLAVLTYSRAHVTTTAGATH